MDPKRTTLCTAIAVLLAGLAGPASAATWTVAKDGTGDFAVIQEAVDAAGSGDVIEIGPGRFDEYQTRWGFDLHVLIPNSMDLTFVGAGSDQTFIGPATPGGHQNLTSGFWGDSDIGLTIRGLSVENCDQFSVGFPSGSLDVSNCRFYFENAYTEDTIGIDGGFTEGAVIRNCVFEGLYQGVATITSPGGVLVENCSFDDCVVGVYAWTGDSSNVRINNCDFDCILTGIEFLTAAGGSVNGCTLSNCRILLSSCSAVTVENSEIARDDEGFALLLQNAEPVTLIGNVLSSNGDVIQCRSYGQGVFRDNHILRTGSGYAIRCLDRSTPYPDIDFSGNWWGTTDPEEIAEAIWDRHDDEAAAHYVIFEPINDTVRVEAHSWSDLKRLFRSP